MNFANSFLIYRLFYRRYSYYPIKFLPLLGSIKPIIKSSKVLLPLPVFPIIPTFSPFLIVKLILSKIGFVSSLYLKAKFLISRFLSKIIFLVLSFLFGK